MQNLQMAWGPLGPIDPSQHKLPAPKDTLPLGQRLQDLALTWLAVYNQQHHGSAAPAATADVVPPHAPGVPAVSVPPATAVAEPPVDPSRASATLAAVAGQQQTAVGADQSAITVPAHLSDAARNMEMSQDMSSSASQPPMAGVQQSSYDDPDERTPAGNVSMASAVDGLRVPADDMAGASPPVPASSFAQVSDPAAPVAAPSFAAPAGTSYV